jgi:hypothetical protein
MQDPNNRTSESQAHKITGGNNPNDDEEILKNTDEPLNEENYKEQNNEREGKIEKSEGSETIGIP